MAMSRRAEIRHADLDGFNDSVLLRTFASLTHQIHVAERKIPELERRDAVVHNPMLATARTCAQDVRSRRDLVEAEILRRMAS